MKSSSRTLRELHVDCRLLNSMAHCSQPTICISSSPTTVRRITCASCWGRKSYPSAAKPRRSDTRAGTLTLGPAEIVLTRRGETYSRSGPIRRRRGCPVSHWHGGYKKLAYVFDPFVNAINANDRSSLITD